MSDKDVRAASHPEQPVSDRLQDEITALAANKFALLEQHRALSKQLKALEKELTAIDGVVTGLRRAQTCLKDLG